MPGLPALRRHTVHQGGPAERMSCLVGDLDGDGVQEFIVSTRNPEQLHWFGRTEGGAWKPHLIDDTFPSISVGGALVDLSGSGRPGPDRRHQRSRQQRLLVGVPGRPDPAVGAPGGISAACATYPRPAAGGHRR